MGNEIGCMACGREDYLDKAVVDAIKAKAGLHKTPVHSFNKLLLQFPNMREGFSKCKEVFKELDQDHNKVIDLRELRLGAQRLGFTLKGSIVEDVFNASDLDGNHMIDVHEFILVLALLYMLEDDSNTISQGLDPAIIKAFSLAESAFLYFGSAKDGYMKRDEVMAAIDEPQACPSSSRAKERHASKSNPIVRRFSEMDWDKNGHISYKEWLFAVQGWVMDDEEEEDE